jgi:hypothetical protein
VRSLRSCVKTLAKGEQLHKEILYYNARDYGTKGLGAFPNPIKETPRFKELYGCFINCRAYSPGTHARKDEDGLLLEFACNPTRARSV